MDIFSTGLTANAFISAAGVSVQETLASIAPVLELIIGILLAFMLARYLIGLFRNTGPEGNRSIEMTADAVLDDLEYDKERIRTTLDI